MVDIRPNPALPNVTEEGKGKWHCSLPFINLLASVGGSRPPPQLRSFFGQNNLNSYAQLFRLSECLQQWNTGNKKSLWPFVLFPPSLLFIHSRLLFLISSFFIAGELTLLSGPLLQGAAVNEGTAVWEKGTFGIFIIPVVPGYLSSFVLILVKSWRESGT